VNNKILITGGAGFIGSNLAKKLSSLGKVVTIVDDMSSSRKDFAEFSLTMPDVEVVNCCFSDKKILSRVLDKEFFCVFHVAAVPRVVYSVENPYETTDVNVLKTTKLLEACINNTERFIFSSSSSVYGGAEIMPTPVNSPKMPKSPYAWQKSCVEDLIVLFSELYGLDATSLRYFNVFGPGQFGDSAYSTAVSAWCHAIKNGTKLRSDGTGEQSRDMCYVDNVVDANVLALNFAGEFKGEKFNIACQDRVTNNQVLEFLKNKFKDIEVTTAPSRPGDVMHTLADISESKQVLGYNPQVSFWDGLNKTLDWWSLN
jgi:nucleoside-diphosphate-sugar epimerase